MPVLSKSPSTKQAGENGRRTGTRAVSVSFLRDIRCSEKNLNPLRKELLEQSRLIRVFRPASSSLNSAPWFFLMPAPALVGFAGMIHR